jgi:hypothetical protein
MDKFERDISPKDGEVKRGRGRPKRSGVAPWEAAGKTKPTYYRHLAEARLKKASRNNGDSDS